jgi:hypothetical protein
MLRGKITNIESIANKNYNLLNSELDDLNYFIKNKYFDGIPPTLRKIVKGNPLTQVQDIIKTSNILVQSVSPTYSNNRYTNISYGTPFQILSLGRLYKYSVTKVEMLGSRYTLILPSLLEPLLTYVVKFVKPNNFGVFTILTKSNEKISYNNGSFRSVKFNNNSTANDYIVLANINISGYNSNWLVIGISENLSGFDFSYN